MLRKVLFAMIATFQELSFIHNIKNKKVCFDHSVLTRRLLFENCFGTWNDQVLSFYKKYGEVKCYSNVMYKK